MLTRSSDVAWRWRRPTGRRFGWTAKAYRQVRDEATANKMAAAKSSTSSDAELSNVRDADARRRTLASRAKYVIAR
jgi:hypothetical protein